MANVNLPTGDALAALSFEHFPTPHQAVIWRNWGLVGPERLASLLGATQNAIGGAAAVMGLDAWGLPGRGGAGEGLQPP